MGSAENFKAATKYYRELLMCGFLYIVVIILESIFCGVTLAEFMRVGIGLVLVTLKCVILLVGMGFVAYLQGLFLPPEPGLTRLKSAARRLDLLQQRYLDGEVFAYGCIGLAVLMCATFYFVQKSLIANLHPFAWDNEFIAIDKFLHLGYMPNDFIVAITEKLHLGGLLDIAYFSWFAMMYAIVGYNLFWDSDRKRRLRFMWVFFLSWVLLGSLLGTVFSAAGPIFYHDFFPNLPDPYKDFVAYIEAHGAADFSIAYHSRFLLLAWTTNGQMVNPNAVAAFPSMHLAIAWLAVLYARSFGRGPFIIALVFTVLIYMATILFGFHYAIDGYVSIILVSLMWWGFGKYLDRQYPDDAPPLRRV
ncbi:MAG: phosphatase PAP2 family protein [Micavibrio sp.]|nr:phosphatase PAP2 family protein [Micavibrio sp.]